VLVAALALPAVAQSEPRTPPGEPVPGSELQLGGMTVVKEFVYVPDGIDDFVTQGGEPRPGVDPGFDAAGGYFGAGRLTGQFLKYLRKNHGPKSEDTWGTSPAKARKGDRIVVSIIPMHGPIASGQAADLQLWLGFPGKKGLPFGAGSWADFFSGNQTVSMGGMFLSEDGVRFGSGRTDLSGLRPGERPDFFGARSRDIGWFDEERTRPARSAGSRRVLTRSRSQW
jgi:hypothetical protein